MARVQLAIEVDDLDAAAVWGEPRAIDAGLVPAPAACC